jgi:hypothetical protein
MRRAFAALAAAAFVSGGIGLAAPAYASPGPFYWCPGDDMMFHAPRGAQNGPGVAYNWDMNICHTWYWVPLNMGNVPYKGELPSGVWDGDNPPALRPDSCDFCWGVG